MMKLYLNMTIIVQKIYKRYKRPGHLDLYQ